MKLTPTHYVVILVIVLFAGLIGARFWSDSRPGEYDAFAQCITDKGATFYGAFWCPHCQAQKRLFGGSADLLPYVECSMPDGQTQKPECTEKGIKSYPTWVFPDGQDPLLGEQSFEELAERTGCELPATS